MSRPAMSRPPTEDKPARQGMKMQADYVIIGSGSAGAAMAYRLSEDGKHSVILLEQGGTDAGPLIQMPAALSYPMNMARYDWGYRTEPEPHLGGRRLATPRGKVIGGSSSINGMVYRARSRARLRPLGGKRRGRLGLCRRPSLLQAHGELARRPGAIRLARHGRPPPCQPRSAHQSSVRDLRGGRRAGRLSESRPITMASSRKASARWSRRSGKAAAGPPPTPI